MREDPIVEEIHRIRRENAARFDLDPKRIAEDAWQRQEKSGREIIRLPEAPPVEMPRSRAV